MKTTKSPVAAVRPYIAENNVPRAQVKVVQPIKASEASEAYEDAVETKLKSLDIAAIKPFAGDIKNQCEDEYKAEKLVNKPKQQVNIEISSEFSTWFDCMNVLANIVLANNYSLSRIHADGFWGLEI